MEYSMPRNVWKFFEDLVNQYKNHPKTSAWSHEVLEQDRDHHRENILERGRANFSEGFNELTPDDKVLLYCYYYMQMHVVSGLHVFSEGNSLFYEYLLSEDKNILFVDFGCGPLTSGVAFAGYYRSIQDTSQQTKPLRPLKFYYLGIDNCEPMLRKAEEFSQYRELFSVKGCTFNFMQSFQEHKNIIEWIDNSVLSTQNNLFLIMLNFSYFFASETLVVEELVQLVIRLLEKYGQNYKICLVFQNPTYSESNKKWYQFKRQLPELITILDKEDELTYYDTTSRRDSQARIRLKYEILTNHSSK
jgi:hypothetical protein